MRAGEAMKKLAPALRRISWSTRRVVYPQIATAAPQPRFFMHLSVSHLALRHCKRCIPAQTRVLESELQYYVTLHTVRGHSLIGGIAAIGKTALTHRGC